MSVKQVSVFLENTPGSLRKVTKLLSSNNIDLIALSIAETRDFGILRAIVADVDKAVRILTEANYIGKITEVLAVAVPDCPGGLDSVLAIFEENNIAVEYMYSFVRTSEDKALLIFRVEDPEFASNVLAANHIRLLSQEEVTVL